MEDKKKVTEIKKMLKSITASIPDFIDTKDQEDKNIYNGITNILGLFDICIIDFMFSDKGVTDLHIKYYSYLMNIYNIDSDKYKIVSGYIDEVYEYLIHLCEDTQLYEAAHNLKQVVFYSQINN
jgi:hypothetical protein